MIDIGRVGLWPWTFLLDEHPTARVREIAQEIEAMGWPTLWRPESTGRDALVSASVLLDATSRLKRFAVDGAVGLPTPTRGAAPRRLR
jgi:hypothetical protein